VVDNNAVTRKQKIAFTEAVAPQPKTQTEIERRARSLSFSDASIAVEWLNATKGTAEYRRALAIRQELEELGATMDSLRQQMQGSTARKAKLKGRQTPFSPQEVEEYAQRAKVRIAFRERHNALNRTLAKYAFVPVMAYDPSLSMWRCASVPKATRGHTVQVSDGALTVHVNESAVIAALARLAANRELYKARLCEQCHESWRVSERMMDRFCSPECRTAWYMKSPDYKKRRQDIQQRYRDGLRTKDAARKGRN
jgi:hypothetical protein